MAHSLELLLDETADQQVRAEWDRLAHAGLPHQGRVASPTNRPHVTMVAAPSIDPDVDQALVPVGMRLPISMQLGAPVLFGRRGRTTLARLVAPSSDLVSVHAQVVRLARPFVTGGRTTETTGTAGTPAEMFDHTQPGRWTPHVTLARRLDTEQLSRALDILELDAEIRGSFVGLRRWDSDAGLDHLLAGRQC